MAARDLMPTETIPGLDMLRLGLQGVECEDDLNELSFSTPSLAGFAGRWFLGLWAGRFISVKELITPLAEDDEQACMLTDCRLHLR